MDDNNLSFFTLNNIKTNYNDLANEILKKWCTKVNIKYNKNIHITNYYKGTYTIDGILLERKLRLKIK